MQGAVAIGALATGMGIGVITWFISITAFVSFVAGVIVAGFVAAAIASAY